MLSKYIKTVYLSRGKLLFWTVALFLLLLPSAFSVTHEYTWTMNPAEPTLQEVVDRTWNTNIGSVTTPWTVAPSPGDIYIIKVGIKGPIDPSTNGTNGALYQNWLSLNGKTNIVLVGLPWSDGSKPIISNDIASTIVMNNESSNITISGFHLTVGATAVGYPIMWLAADATGTAIIESNYINYSSRTTDNGRKSPVGIHLEALKYGPIIIRDNIIEGTNWNVSSDWDMYGVRVTDFRVPPIITGNMFRNIDCTNNIQDRIAAVCVDGSSTERKAYISNNTFSNVRYAIQLKEAEAYVRDNNFIPGTFAPGQIVATNGKETVSDAYTNYMGTNYYGMRQKTNFNAAKAAIPNGPGVGISKAQSFEFGEYWHVAPLGLNGDWIAPLTPLTATNYKSGSSIVIDWTHTAPTFLAGFNIFRGNVNMTYESLDGAPVSSGGNLLTYVAGGRAVGQYMDSSIDTNETYTYLISAVDVNSNESWYTSVEAPPEVVALVGPAKSIRYQVRPGIVQAINFNKAGASDEVTGTLASHGLRTWDRVKVSNTSAASTLGESTFQVRYVDANSFKFMGTTSTSTGSGTATIILMRRDSYESDTPPIADIPVDYLEFRIMYNQTVVTTGTPYLSLSTGGKAYYNSAASSASYVVFTNYIDGSTPEGTINVNGFSFNGGAIKTALGTYDCPALGTNWYTTLYLTNDKTAPSKPSTPNLTADTDTGLLMTDNVTANDNSNSSRKLTFGGKAEEGSYIALFIDDVARTPTTTADSATGVWSITLDPQSADEKLSEGAHTVTVQATDPAGNTSVRSDALTITIDITPPPIVSNVVYDSSTDTGMYTNDFITTNRSGFKFSGKGAPGNKVSMLFDNDVQYPEAFVDANGDWTITVTNIRNSGDDKVTVRQTDLAGNTSKATNMTNTSFTDLFKFYIDYYSPGSRSLEATLAPSDDTGYKSDDYITSKTNGFTVNLTLNNRQECWKIEMVTNDQDHPVSWLDGINRVYAFVTNSDTNSTSSWSPTVTVNLSDGIYDLRAYAYDIPGNKIKDDDMPKDVQVDGYPPQPFELLSPSNMSFVKKGDSPNFQWQTAADYPSVGMSGIYRYRIQVTTTSGNYSSTVVDFMITNNSYTTGINTSSFATVAHYWRVIAEDKAGLTRECSEEFSFTVDGAAPSVSSYSPADDGTHVGNAALVLTFNEEVRRGVGKVQVKRGSDDSVAKEYDVQSSAVEISSNVVRVFINTDPLAINTAYYINMADSLFTDLVGNKYAGISDKVTWNFTTLAAHDFVQPADFKLLGPKNGEYASNREMLFIWEKATDADSGLSHYVIELNALGSAESIFNTAGNILATNYVVAPVGTHQTVSGKVTIPSTQPQGNLYWRVVAYDYAGNKKPSQLSGSHDARNFYFDPTSITSLNFTNKTPTNYTHSSSVTPTLTWEATDADTGSGLMEYRVMLSASNSFEQSVLATNNFEASEGWSAQTADSWSVTDNNSKAWTTGTDGTSSKISIATHAARESGFGALFDNAGDYLQFPDLTAPGMLSFISRSSNEVTTGDHIFKVQYWNGSAWADLSSQVRTNNSMRWVEQTFDLNIATNTAGASRFRLLLSAMGTDGSAGAVFVDNIRVTKRDCLIATVSGSTLTYTVPSASPTKLDLTDGTYYWKVAAYDFAGNALTNSVKQFTVDTTAPQAFSLLSPPDTEKETFINFDPPEPGYQSGTNLGQQAGVWWGYENCDDEVYVAGVKGPLLQAGASAVVSNSENFTGGMGVLAFYVMQTTSTPVDLTVSYYNGATWTDVKTVTTSGDSLEYYVEKRIVANINNGSATKIRFKQTGGGSGMVGLGPIEWTKNDAGSPKFSTNNGFSWLPSSDNGMGLSHYILAISSADGGTFDANIKWTNHVGDTPYLTNIRISNYSGYTEGNTYYWRVTAYDKCPTALTTVGTKVGPGTGTTYNSFVLDITPPAAPVLGDSPTNLYQTASPTAMNFYFAPIADPGDFSHYAIKIATNEASLALGIIATEGGTAKSNGVYPYDDRANDTNISVSIASLSDGHYYWHAVSYDTAGNTNAASPRRITIDRTAPSKPTLAWPLAGGYAKQAQPGFSWLKSTDGLTEVKQYLVEVSLSNDNFETYTVEASYIDAASTLLNSTSNVGVVDLSSQPDGTYYWRVIAYDSLSNTATSDIQSFSLDFIRPYVVGALSWSNTNGFIPDKNSGSVLLDANLYIRFNEPLVLKTNGTSYVEIWEDKFGDGYTFNDGSTPFQKIPITYYDRGFKFYLANAVSNTNTHQIISANMIRSNMTGSVSVVGLISNNAPYSYSNNGTNSMFFITGGGINVFEYAPEYDSDGYLVGGFYGNGAYTNLTNGSAVITNNYSTNTNNIGQWVLQPLENGFISVNPSGAFTPLSKYYVKITTGGIMDRAENDFTGVLSHETWRFTAVNAPVIQNVYITNSAKTNTVGDSIYFKIVFSQPVDIGYFEDYRPLKVKLNVIGSNNGTVSNVIVTTPLMAMSSAPDIEFTYTVGSNDNTPAGEPIRIIGIEKTDTNASYIVKPGTYRSSFQIDANFAAIPYVSNNISSLSPYPASNIIDTLGPVPPVVTTTPETTNRRPTWVWKQATNSDGINVYRYHFNFSDFVSLAAEETTNTNYTANEDLEDGYYTVYVQERDHVGNWSDSGTFLAHIDNLPPIINGIPGNISTNAAFDMYLSVTKNSGYWSTNGTSYMTNEIPTNTTERITINGPCTFYYYSKDAIGNHSETNSRTFTWDTNAPVISGAPDAFVAYYPKEVSLSVDENYGYWSTNGQLFFQFTTNGTKIAFSNTITLRYFGRDGLGNNSATNSVKYSIFRAKLELLLGELDAVNRAIRLHYAFDFNESADIGFEYRIKDGTWKTIVSDNLFTNYTEAVGATNYTMREPAGGQAEAVRGLTSATNDIYWKIPVLDTRYNHEVRAVLYKSDNALVLAEDIVEIPTSYLDKLFTVPDRLTKPVALNNVSTGGPIKLVSIPRDAIVEIFTLDGNKINTLVFDDYTGAYEWNLETADGKRVGAGVYICRVQTGSKDTDDEMVIYTQLVVKR